MPFKPSDFTFSEPVNLVQVAISRIDEELKCLDKVRPHGEKKLFFTFDMQQALSDDTVKSVVSSYKANGWSDMTITTAGANDDGVLTYKVNLFF